ncbi:alpha/beta fold hydrolase [Nonomuraea sp. NPDC050663]|uniref:alpha/beta fold hydrolase n=1 Tax=Nonomuraea sp. NPDC050663 TaxID=3364370 RepID=UPI0037AA184E
MSEEKAVNVGPAKIEIAYERFGDPSAPPVVLIMGIGVQMLGWAEEFCTALAGEGLHVVRFDNRDVGLSTHLHDAPAPDLPAAMAGDMSSASYTLSDMAADTVGLLDALGLASAHLVGGSLGGAIAQTVAIEHPGRVRSLTSIMSTTGDLSVGQARPEALAALAGGGPATTRQEVIDQMLRVSRAVRSPGFAPDEAALAERTGRSFDRSYDPVGIARQAVASLASGDRTGRLRSVSVPTLVVHGADDVMCDVSGGHATAAAIPGAELVIIDGMGHDIPRDVRPRLISLITALVERAEKERRE